MEKVAFTGGTNLADEYINKKERFGHWKDTAVMIPEMPYRNLPDMFLEMWHTTVKKEPDYESYLTPKSILKEKDGYVIPYDVMPYGTERVGKTDLSGYFKYCLPVCTYYDTVSDFRL